MAILPKGDLGEWIPNSVGRRDQSRMPRVMRLPGRQEVVLGPCRTLDPLFHPMRAFTTHEEIIRGKVVGEDGARGPGFSAVGAE